MLELGGRGRGHPILAGLPLNRGLGSKHRRRGGRAQALTETGQRKPKKVVTDRLQAYRCGRVWGPRAARLRARVQRELA